MAQSLRQKFAILSVPAALILLVVLLFFAITQSNTREVVNVESNLANELLPPMYKVPLAAREVSVQRNWRRDPSWWVKLSLKSDERDQWKQLIEQQIKAELVEVHSADDLSGCHPPIWFDPDFGSCRILQTDSERGPRQMTRLIFDEANEIVYLASVSRY